MSSDEEDVAFYGNALDPIDEDSIPRKKPITAEDQFAKDEHGRRRFHGAFTGGFSAGFYNSVGSLGGWQPTNFISSRASRAASQGQSVFDFMDDEDTGEHGICPMSLKVKPDFDNKTPSSNSKKRSRLPVAQQLHHAPAIQKMLAPARDTVGVKLLMKMGWKPGQGVGPRITKKEKKNIKQREKTIKKVYGCNLPTEVNKSDAESSESDFDIDLDEITFAPDDYQSYVVNPKQNTFGIGYQGMDRNPILSAKKPETSVLTVGGKTIRGQAFGVSVFEDDDEDIYSTEDMSNYDFSLPSAKEKKKAERKSRFEPVKNCIEGFHVAYKPPQPREIFPLPVVPEDFIPLQSRKNRWDVTTRTVMPKKVTSVTERNKIFNDASTNPGKDADVESKKTENVVQPVPETFKATNASSFKPYAADVEKQERYEKFLMFKDLGLKDRISSIYPKTMTEWEKQREITEFEQSARVYRPLADDLARRFTSSSKVENINDISTPFEKTTDPDLEMMKNAAEKKMYGLFTRRTFDWIPDKIVCKRFNIPEPFTNTLQNAADKKSKQNRSSIFDFLKTSSINNPPNTTLVPKSENAPIPEPESDEQVDEKEKETPAPEELDSDDEEISHITNKIDLFKAIFLDSSDDEEEKEKEENTNKVQDVIPPSEPSSNESEKIENPVAIVRSPARGIFANLDLELLRTKPHSRSEPDPPKKTSNELSEPIPKTIKPLLYGPQLPIGLPCSNVKIEPRIEYVKPKNKNEDVVWVEKSKKHKKHEKHKKHKKQKHKKHK